MLKPKAIGVTRPDATGALVLHLKDSLGKVQMVALTPDQRVELGRQLISGPLLEGDTGSPALYLSPANTRLYLRQDGDLALELQLGTDRAIHVLLPGLIADALALQIQEVRGPLPNVAH